MFYPENSDQSLWFDGDVQRLQRWVWLIWDLPEHLGQQDLEKLKKLQNGLEGAWLGINQMNHWSSLTEEPN